QILLGHARWLAEQGADLGALRQSVAALEAAGHSVSWLAEQRDGSVPAILAAFAFADEVRPGAREAVTALKRMGVHTVLISGDGQGAVERVARELGVDRFEAQVTPAQKVAHIAHLKRDGRIVGMVGDGINDAPALAAADVGIAMGSGTDIAIESAIITLLKSDLSGIVKARRLSQATMRNIRQNLFFA